MSSEAGLRFIERCGGPDDTVSLVAEFLAIAASFGLEHGAGGAWTGMGAARHYRFYFNTWPADWIALYNERGIFGDDPVISEAQRRMVPFRWRDMQAERRLTDEGIGIWDLALSYGWVDGLVVPVHGPSGYQGVVSLATKRPLALSAAAAGVLWVMALAVHERCRTTQGLGTDMPARLLTKREGECMRWIAAGKTEWETAQLLGISAATVHFHVEKVKQRLQTSSRTAAVALLVLHGAL